MRLYHNVFFCATYPNQKTLGNLFLCRQNRYILSFIYTVTVSKRRKHFSFGDVFIDTQPIQRSEKLTRRYFNLFVSKIKEIGLAGFKLTKTTKKVGVLS